MSPAESIFAAIVTAALIAFAGAVWRFMSTTKRMVDDSTAIHALLAKYVLLQVARKSTPPPKDIEVEAALQVYAHLRSNVSDPYLDALAARVARRNDERAD